MQKFRKRPEVIEAVNFTRNNWDEVKRFTNGLASSLIIEKCINGTASCLIQTLNGPRVVLEGDWIIKDENREFYRCNRDAFNLIYESIE